MHEAYYYHRTTLITKQKTKSFPTLEFYVSLVFHHLSYSADLQNEVEIISSADTCITLRYRNYKAVGLTLPNFTVQALTGSIRPETILELVKLLLLEKKIILVRDNCSDNALLIETLLMLMSPLYVFFFFFFFFVIYIYIMNMTSIS